MQRRIAITGIGAVTPLGTGVEPLFERWCAGERGFEDGFGRCSSFDPAEHLSKREVRRSDRFTQLAVTAAHEALDGAGWTAGLPVEADRIGCVVGTGFGGMQTVEEQARHVQNGGGRRVSPLGISLAMPNAAPGMIALRYGLKGLAHGVVAACAAGADAIGTAARLICAGDAEAMVAGGSDACLTAIGITFTEKAGMMSKLGAMRPFDVRRDGLLLGEGAGMLVLEDYELAEGRGAPILAELLGYGASADAFHLAAPHPEGDGAARAIRLALRDAGLEPGDVDYVNAHGTSTPLNDRAETLALKAALGEDAYRVPVSSTKSVIGHLCGAAGAAEAAVTVLALQRRTAPPTVGYEEPDEELDLNYVPGEPQPIGTSARGDGRAVALSNSFGFGGHNAVLCIAA
ncbi:MAG TPA: beta-ketoacyl-ACP synthase II [Thermoleophilaceae bacterium]